MNLKDCDPVVLLACLFVIAVSCALLYCVYTKSKEAYSDSDDGQFVVNRPMMAMAPPMPPPVMQAGPMMMQAGDEFKRKLEDRKQPPRQMTFAASQKQNNPLYKFAEGDISMVTSVNKDGQKTFSIPNVAKEGWYPQTYKTSDLAVVPAFKAPANFSGAPGQNPFLSAFPGQVSYGLSGATSFSSNPQNMQATMSATADETKQVYSTLL